MLLELETKVKLSVLLCKIQFFFFVFQHILANYCALFWHFLVQTTDLNRHMWKCKASKWSPAWRSYSPFVRWNEISSGLIFWKVLIVTLKSSSSMLGLMGLYLWLWCWVRADPGDPEQGKSCHNPDRAKRCMGRDNLKKQADHIFARAWVQRHRNWFQKGNGLNEHQCCTGSQIWGRIVTICLKPHAFKAAISICPYPRTMWLFRWNQLIMVLLCALFPFSVFIFALVHTILLGWTTDNTFTSKSSREMNMTNSEYVYLAYLKMFQMSIAQWLLGSAGWLPGCY